MIGFWLKYLEPFKNKTITLIGFSLGTTVLVSWLKFLHKCDEFNLIHDWLLMGGAYLMK